MTLAIGLFRTALIMNNQQEKILLSEEQLRFLKKSAHHLKPIVQLGKKGVSPALINEINQALLDHELIKVQVLPVQKPELEENLEELIAQTGAQHVATIGNVVILFKAREEGSTFFQD